MIRRLALSLAALVVALVIAELALRARGFDPVGELRASSLSILRRSSDANIAYEFVPGASARAWGCEVRINAEGFRDRDLTHPRAAGTRRIAVLGDSVAFGTGLDARDAFPARLEVELAGQSVDVQSLAVPGYDITQEVALLERVAARYRPDLVVLAYCVNDVGVHSLSHEYIGTLERYERPWFALRTAQWLARELDRRAAVDWTARANAETEFARRFAARMSTAAPDAELESLRAELASYCAAHASELTANPFLGWYTSAGKLARLRFELARLAALSREHSFAALVACLPYLESARHPRAYAQSRAIVRRTCELEQLAFVDLHDLIEHVGPLALRQTPADGLHLNAEGHARIARELATHCGERLSAQR